MIIYSKDTMDALKTLIITRNTEISNSAIIIINCGIRNKIHRLINNQTIGNKIKQIFIWNNEK